MDPTQLIGNLGAAGVLGAICWYLITRSLPKLFDKHEQTTAMLLDRHDQVVTRIVDGHKAECQQLTKAFREELAETRQHCIFRRDTAPGHPPHRDP